tara:strand:- start:652 stop:2550 length:1899 start_codon:yes stop_codon:yes gene_type:complete
MSESLKNTLSIIVYLPLIIICLSVVGSIGYGIYTYRTTGNFPPSWVSAGRIFLYILKQILYTLKLLGQFLWWLVPIFPDRYRAPNGFTPLGAWDSVNRIKTIPLLAFATFLTISILIFQYGLPSTIVGYSNVINIIVASGLIISILGLFFVFNKQIISGAAGISPMPGDNRPNAQFNWLFQNTSKYLFLSIAVGLALAILVLFIRFGLQNTLFSVTGTTFIMIASGLIGLTMIYYMLKSNPAFMNVINSSMSMSGLFYAFFILPCIFFEITRFLYNHLRHTPRTAYVILAAEILLISLYYVVPILVKKFYVLTPGKDNKDIILQNKINSAQKDLIVITERILQIYRYQSGNGPLGKDNWNTIITKYYNSKDNEDDLIKWLTDFGYKTKKMCDDDNGIDNKFDCERKLKNMVTFIQENTTELVTLREKKKDLKRYIKDLKNQKKQLTQFTSGKVLLREPVYLNNLKTIGGFDDFNVDKIDLEYNYNYSISSWFFIRANAPNFKKSYNKYSIILNYGDKPKIMYNPSLNKIKIIMNNGLNKKPIEYIIDGPPLQKWNNLVINYDGGNLDIFMNSKLVRSFPSVVPYMSFDQLTVGEDNGLGGGICNVVYFPSIISRERIITNYNLLKNNNPPII